MLDFSNAVTPKLSVVALINCDAEITKIISQHFPKNSQLIAFKNGMELLHQWNQNDLDVVLIISQSEVMSPSGVSLLEIIKNKKRLNIPFVILCKHWNEKIMKIALQAGVAEVFHLPFNFDKFETRISFIVENWFDINQLSHQNEPVSYRTPIVKRIFDIIVSGSALVLLAPIFIVIGVFVRIESKGPVFYYSFRVGRGYQIFKFYKFRSMFLDSDKKLKDLKHLNQYANSQDSQNEDASDIMSEYKCDDCRTAGTDCQFPIYSDAVQMCEKEYMYQKLYNLGSTFIKIKDDPRMTKIGKLIRRTSLDELPQLWNVLIGDMSIVGNRPLPLYEAEKLTTDKYALRFMAPAGITGLWQVEKRGTSKMSENERLLLDNIYAKNNSFLNDIILILRTLPALFQKENV